MSERDQQRADKQDDQEMVKRLHATTDASVWAEEFNRTLYVLGKDHLDEGWLIGWFANAIEVGRDAGKRAMPSAGTRLMADEDVMLSQQREIERLEALVYVPGVWKCAKCNLSLISTTLNATNGSMKANTEPQQCPNGCGPLWRKTERDAGNELCDRIDAMAEELRVARSASVANK